MKVYDHPLSTFSRRVRMVLLEKGVAAQFIEVDMAGGAHRGADYRAKNPYGRIPTLDDEGFVLYESTAILEYLEMKYPSPPLLPSDPRDRAHVAMYMKLCDLEIGVFTPTLIYPRRFLPEERWNRVEMEHARQAIAGHLEILATDLGNRPYLVGGAFSLAEVCYAPFLEFLPLLEVPTPRTIASWAERVLARPSATNTRPAR